MKLYCLWEKLDDKNLHIEIKLYINRTMLNIDE